MKIEAVNLSGIRTFIFVWFYRHGWQLLSILNIFVQLAFHKKNTFVSRSIFVYRSLNYVSRIYSLILNEVNLCLKLWFEMKVILVIDMHFFLNTKSVWGSDRKLINDLRANFIIHLVCFHFIKSKIVKCTLMHVSFF